MGQTYIRDNQGVKPADLREDSVTGLDGPLGRAAPELRGLRHRPSLGRLPVLARSVNMTRSNILGQLGISPGIFRILVLSGNALSVCQSLLAQSLMSYREAAKLVVLVLGVVVDRIGVTIQIEDLGRSVGGHASGTSLGSLGRGYFAQTPSCAYERNHPWG
jgi:hypothetical protein